MTDVLKVLTNIRSLRALTRDLPLQQVEAILEKILLITEEKREQEAQAERELAARQQRLVQYKELLEKEGVTAEELIQILGTEPTKRAKREPRPAKYQYTDENGMVKTWTGQGRTPRAIQAALNAGKKLSSFEI